MTTLHFLKEPERDPHVPRAPDTAHIAFFRKASRLLAWASVSLAILGLIDTLLGGHAAAEHHHLWHHYLPHQSLSSLIGFLLLGFGVIAAHAVRAPGRWKVQVGLGAAVILLNVLSTNFFTGTVWRQSGLTTWVILLLGFSLVTGASRLPIIGYVRQSALFVMFFLSGLVVVGHAYELAGSAPYLANYLLLPWTTALTAVIVGHAMLFQYPNFGVMRLVSGEGFGCHIMRRLLPSVILLLVVLGGLLAFGESRDLYPPSFGEGLYAILAVTGFSGILLFTTSSLNRLDGERRAREEDLRRSQAQLQAVLDQIPSIICIKSTTERYLMVNRQFVNKTGIPAEACIGRTTPEILPAATAAVIQSGFRRALRTQSAISSVEMFPAPETEAGHTTYLSAHFPLLNSEGKAYAVCGVYTDVSDIKRQEEEIRSLNESLREKTLRQEAANAELEAFSYSVSHDLRAPLRHIAGFGKLLAQRNQGKLDEKSTHYLNVIEVSVQRMGALIDDLLSFSRASKIELASRRVKTRDLVEDVRAELGAQHAGPPATWEIADLPDMYGDPAMLRLVWVNLLSNALKYSSRTSAPRIIVSHEPQEQGGVFSVRDNGAGFDMRYADKLFGVFQRLHSNQEYEGTGIGLAMVRRILERHGGRIWADATPGAGASFFFTLPDKAPANSSSRPLPVSTPLAATSEEGTPS